MNLTLKLNNSTVKLAGRSVKLVEEYDSKTEVNRFVETVARCTDEAASNYILDIDYQESNPLIRNIYNSLVERLNRTVRIYDTFSIQTPVLGLNVGAGFCGLVSREDYETSVGIVRDMMRVLGLDNDYQLVTRYENQGVYALVRK